MIKRMLSKEEIDAIPDFDPSLVSDVMTDKALKILQQLDNHVIVIEHHFDENEMTFRKYILGLFNIIKEGFEHREFRYHAVSYKFRDDPEEEVKWLPFNMFIVNCIFWYPCICLDPDSLNNDLIVSPFRMPDMSPALIKEYFDDIYVERYTRHIPSKPNIPITRIGMELSHVFGVATWLFTRTSADFCMFYGISTSVEIYMNLAKKFPRLNEIYHTQLDESLQPYELEEQINAIKNEFVSIVMKDQDFNSLKPLYIKGGVKLDQEASVVAAINLKPDIDGSTIPYPIMTNYLIGGLRNLIDYYVVAISGRKAAIFNKEYMGRSGYLMILADMMCVNVKLSKTTMDCGSPNPIPIEIKTEKHLEKLDGRRYRFGGEKEYKIIKPKRDKHLIGETVFVRSPETCACKDGICRECYGELYYINVTSEAPGIFSATHVMNPVAQSVLSAKHFQNTSTDSIRFDKDFYNFFAIEATDIVLDIDKSIIPSEYTLILWKDDINSDDGGDIELNYSTRKRRRKRKKITTEFDEVTSQSNNEENEESVEDLPYYTSKFELVRYFGTDKEEHMVFVEKGEKELYISTFLIENMTAIKDEGGDYLYIPLEEVEQDKFIFRADALSNEVTKPMKKIQNLLNNAAHEGCSTYQEITNKMLDLLIESKLDPQLVHAEIMIRQLIRQTDNRIRRPDFSKIVSSKDYKVMTVISALKTCPSVIIALCNSYLKEQLVSLPETFRKDATSLLDDLFRQKLYGHDY